MDSFLSNRNISSVTALDGSTTFSCGHRSLSIQTNPSSQTLSGFLKKSGDCPPQLNQISRAMRSLVHRPSETVYDSNDTRLQGWTSVVFVCAADPPATSASEAVSKLHEAARLCDSAWLGSEPGAAGSAGTGATDWGPRQAPAEAASATALSAHEEAGAGAPVWDPLQAPVVAAEAAALSAPEEAQVQPEWFDRHCGLLICARVSDCHGRLLLSNWRVVISDIL